MADKLTIDLHPIFRHDRDIDRVVRAAVLRAARAGIPVVEVIVGKGKGQLRDRVVKMLGAAHLKRLYRRLEIDPDNEGRVLVHF